MNVDKENKEDIKEYGVKAAIDWLFKKSPVTYFIGVLGGIASMALSDGLSLNVSENSLSINYSNTITAFSAFIVVLCLSFMYGAVRMQMKERAFKHFSDQEVKLLKVQYSLEKEVEELKAKLELEKKKAANKHNNIGKGCNDLLNKIVRLKSIFADCNARKKLADEYLIVDGQPLDIYIFDAYKSQDMLAPLYRDDTELHESWKQLIEQLQHSQAAITQHLNGQPLNLTPLTSTYNQLIDFVEKIHNSGHQLDFNYQ